MTDLEIIKHLEWYKKVINLHYQGTSACGSEQEVFDRAIKAIEKQTHNCRNCRYCFTCLGVEYKKGQSAIAFDGYCWKWEADND